MNLPLAFLLLIWMASSAFSQPVSGITLRDSTLRFGPGIQPRLEVRRGAITLRQQIGPKGEAEFGPNGLKWFRGNVGLVSHKRGGNTSFRSIKETIQGNESFVGFAGDLDSIQMDLDPNGHRIHRINRSQNGIPYFRGEFVVASDDDALTEFYGTAITPPTNTTYSIDSSSAAARALYLANTGKHVIHIAKVIFNRALIDQAATNKSIPAWLVRLRGKERVSHETITILDGQSGALLYSEEEKYHLLNRTIWSGAEDLTSQYSIFNSDRYEGGPISESSEIENVFKWIGTWHNTFLKYNRDGTDGNGLRMHAFINYKDQINCPTAFHFIETRQETPTAATMVICPGLALDDVVYHEATHGLISFTAKFNLSQNITKGLHEGFADAFAYLIGRKWILCEGKTTKGHTIPRYAAKPSLDNAAKPDPAKRSIDTWSQYTSSLDPHALSGLVSHPAYLMTNGGAGAGSDMVLGRGYEITKDLYYATLLRLTSNSNFKDFGKMLVAQAKAGFSYGPKSTACDALMAIRSVGLHEGISTDVCTDKRKNVAVLFTH